MLVRRRGIAVKSELVRVRDFMEEQPQTTNKVYRHYAHSDSCNPSRWTARESYEYMYARPWHRVNDFYSDLVNGRSSLSELFGAENGVEPFAASIERQTGTSPPDEQIGRWARVTFKIVLSYHGESFDGWQRQPGLNTVQGLVEKSLGKFVDDKKAQQIKEKGLPIEGIAVVAGRTDKGVTALNQVCSFYTWRKDIRAQDIECAVNAAAPRKLRVLSVTQVSRVFHPNFSAKWRRYLYIFPFSEGDDRKESNHENLEDLERVKKPSSFSITRVDQLLRHLEGKLLSYKMFARDTKASRNIGPPTECFLYHARAAEARLPCSKEVPADAVKVMCVELVANRFLRKMVRVLVATAIREAAAGAEDEIMLKLMEATCRRATAPPAPPDGLCLVDVGYADFVSEICCIP